MSETYLETMREVDTQSRVGKVCLILVAMLLATSGCNQPVERDVYAVEGILFVNGSPAANASVAFHPVKPGSIARYPVARTDRGGRFQLTTNSPFDGAPAGDYTVTVVWIDETIPFDECECDNPLQHDRLKGYYADAELTELHATVRRSDNSLTFYARQPPEYAAPRILSKN